MVSLVYGGEKNILENKHCFQEYFKQIKYMWLLFILESVMKKVMFYCHVFYPQNTGYSNAFQNLINSILDNIEDIHITVVTPYPLGGHNELNKKNLEVVRLKKRTNIRFIRYFFNDYSYSKFISNKFIRESYDLLVVETFDSPIFLNFLDSSIYSKTVVRIHSTNETEYTIFDKSLSRFINKTLLQKFVSKKVVNIASTNSFHIEFVKKYYWQENVIDIGDKNFFILPNTIQANSNISVKKPKNKLKLFTLGRMQKLGLNQKGFLDFIYALKLLDKEILDRFEITIVGSGDGKEHLVKLAKGYDNITFIDELSHENTIQALNDSDIVLLPSRYEGLSMFALEGLQAGNLAIFSKTGGLIDLIDNNGFFFEPQNIEQLAYVLKQVALLSDNEILLMKERSLEIINNKFTPKIVANKFNKILQLLSD